MTDNDWRTDTPWPDPWEEKEGTNDRHPQNLRRSDIQGI